MWFLRNRRVETECWMCRTQITRISSCPLTDDLCTSCEADVAGIISLAVELVHEP